MKKFDGLVRCYEQWLQEDKAYYSNRGYDRDNFPKVDAEYLQYSKASSKALKKIARNLKVDPRGGKRQVLGTILARLNGKRKVQGYYDRITHTDIPSVKAREKAKNYDDIDT